MNVLHVTRRRNLKTKPFFSTFRPTIHTDPSQKRSFSQTLVKPVEISKRQFFVFVWRVTFWTRSIPCPSFPRTQIHRTFLNSSGLVYVDWKHITPFQSETSVFSYLWCSVLGALVNVKKKKKWKTRFKNDSAHFVISICTLIIILLFYFLDSLIFLSDPLFTM